MSKSLVTNDYKVHNAVQLLESVSETANSVYYMFAGNHKPMTRNRPTNPKNSPVDTVFDVYDNMIFGKRIGINDVSLVIDRNNYVANTVYDMYDDQVEFSNNSYVCVNNGAYSHVFKCLFNNGGSPSTYEPNFADTDADDQLYVTTDNYVWKYMYSVTDAKVAKFGSTSYFPVEPNTEVAAAAVPGAIYVIKVENEGAGYDNYLTGKFRSDELRINSSLVYSIESANGASADTGFYNGCYIVITNGAASGKYAKISQYTVNSTAKHITLEEPFSINPALNSTWEITPGVVIDGDSNQTINAAARAIINSVANTIDRIEILNIGAGYRYANAYVRFDSTVGVTEEAELRPIYAPIFGHGSNVYSELNASKICFSTTFGNTYNDPHLIHTNDYRQVGLLKDPKFKDVTFTLANTLGTFTADEIVSKIRPLRVYAVNVSINSTSNSLVASDADFNNQFNAGDFVYVTSDTSQMVTSVQSITNSTVLVMDSVGMFACSDAKVFLPNMTSNGYITSSSVGSIECSNVTGTFASNDTIVGLRTGAIATINSISRSAVTKGFDTFIQMYKYNITLNDTALTEDETVYLEELGVANAVLHSVGEANTVLYVTSHRGTFNAANDIVGNTSGSSATITAKYSPELEYGSGDILYVENLTPIARQENQKEVFKIVFEY